MEFVVDMIQWKTDPGKPYRDKIHYHLDLYYPASFAAASSLSLKAVHPRHPEIGSYQTSWQFQNRNNPIFSAPASSVECSWRFFCGEFCANYQWVYLIGDKMRSNIPLYYLVVCRVGWHCHRHRPNQWATRRFISFCRPKMYLHGWSIAVKSRSTKKRVNS
jgi:hypothetical protein